MAADLPVEALARYEAARDRAVGARLEWDAAGNPFVIVYTNGLEGVHPILKVLQDAEKHADLLMKSLGTRQAKGGRPPGSQSAPDRSEPPKRVALKAVK